MKNALILHGTDADSTCNWFPWLKEELEKLGYKVWLPDLPDANKPNALKYNKFILENKNWDLNKESVIIGHSSGAVAILGLLDTLPKNTIVKKCILVGSFNSDLGWGDILRGLFIKPFDFENIKKHSKEFIFLHSENDLICPLDDAKYLSKQLNGKLIITKNDGHFVGPDYAKLPILLDLIK